MADIDRARVEVVGNIVSVLRAVKLTKHLGVRVQPSRAAPRRQLDRGNSRCLAWIGQHPFKHVGSSLPTYLVVWRAAAILASALLAINGYRTAHVVRVTRYDEK